MANESKPEVAVVMGSASDWETMKRAGATNAGLLAVQMLSAFEPELAAKLEDYRNELKEKVAESNAQLV